VPIFCPSKGENEHQQLLNSGNGNGPLFLSSTSPGLSEAALARPLPPSEPPRPNSRWRAAAAVLGRSLVNFYHLNYLPVARDRFMQRSPATCACAALLAKHQAVISWKFNSNPWISLKTSTTTPPRSPPPFHLVCCSLSLHRLGRCPTIDWIQL